MSRAESKLRPEIVTAHRRGSLAQPTCCALFRHTKHFHLHVKWAAATEAKWRTTNFTRNGNVFARQHVSYCQTVQMTAGHWEVAGRRSQVIRSQDCHQQSYNKPPLHSSPRVLSTYFIAAAGQLQFLSVILHHFRQLHHLASLHD